MSSTELVPASGGIVPLDVLEEGIAVAVERGDEEALHKAARWAEAGQLYERRASAKLAGDQYGRLKVLAEAGIGAIDLAREPELAREASPLVIGDVEVSNTTRRDWRLLAVAHERAILRPTLDAIIGDPEQEISTFSVVNAVERAGVNWVPIKALRQAALAQREQGISISEIARRSGCARGSVSNLLNGNCRKTQRTFWRTAVSLAEALGVDPSALPLAPAPSPRKVTSGRRLPRERKLRGSRWDEAYVRMRRTMNEVQALTGMETRYDELWGHLHAAHDLIAREMKRT